MVRRTVLLSCCFAFAGFFVDASAQAPTRNVASATTASTPAPAATSSAHDALSAIRTQLRNLAVAQEGYYANHGTYTTDVSALGLFKDGSPAESVHLRVIFAGGRSWMADGVTAGANGKSCVMYIGDLRDFPAPPATQQSKLAPTRQGAPVCDPE